jgi:hypothetical protein
MKPSEESSFLGYVTVSVGEMFPYVLMEHGAFTFRVHQFNDKASYHTRPEPQATPL